QYGYTRNEFAGLTASDLNGNPDPDSIEERRKQFEKDGRLSGEHIHKKKGGRVFPVEVNANLIDYGGKKVMQVFSRDISERKLQREALEESEQRFRQLSNAAMEGLAIHDGETIVAANQALANMF